MGEGGKKSIRFKEKLQIPASQTYSSSALHLTSNCPSLYSENNTDAAPTGKHKN